MLAVPLHDRTQVHRPRIGSLAGRNKKCRLSLELFAGSFPLRGLLFPSITASPGIVRSILVPFDLRFDLSILGFPQFHAPFEPLHKFSRRWFVTAQAHTARSLRQFHLPTSFLNSLSNHLPPRRTKSNLTHQHSLLSTPSFHRARVALTAYISESFLAFLCADLSFIRIEIQKRKNQ